MKIIPIQQTKQYQPKELVKQDDETKLAKKNETLPAAATYEKSAPEEKSFTYDKVSIERLKQQSEQHYDQLIRMVEDLLKRQGMSLKTVTPDAVIEVDEVTRTKAAALIAPDGPLGVEAVSENIVAFAKAISGGDKSKLATLREAIDQGFAEAEKILGELPDISRQTYDRVMEKLDQWENE